VKLCDPEPHFEITAAPIIATRESHAARMVGKAIGLAIKISADNAIFQQGSRVVMPDEVPL
jgi:hypothetical protein